MIVPALIFLFLAGAAVRVATADGEPVPPRGPVHAVTTVVDAGPGLPGWLVGFLLGALVAAVLVSKVSFRAGQYARGWGHARGIRKAHWAAIQGGGH